MAWRAHSSTLHQIGVVPAEPRQHVISEVPRQLAHLRCVGIRDDTDTFVTGNIPLFPERVEGRDEFGARTNRLAERLDDPDMMLGPRCSIPRRGKGDRCHLQAGVIGDIHSPVGAHASCRAVGEVTLDDGEQVCDFSGAGDVRCQPPVFLPVGQAHGHFR